MGKFLFFIILIGILFIAGIIACWKLKPKGIGIIAWVRSGFKK